MKKFMMFAILLAVSLFTFSASAKTENELYSYMTQNVKVNGKTYAITASAKNQLKQFLKNNELSATDCDKLSQYYDKALKLVKDSGAKSYKKYIASHLSEAVSLANNVSADIEAIESITIANNGEVTIVDANGKQYVITDPVDSTNNSAPIKNTGNIFVYTTLGVSILGVLLFVTKIRKENN